MLKIREAEYSKRIIFIERVFQPHASPTQIRPPHMVLIDVLKSTCINIEVHSQIKLSSNLFCFAISESRDSVIQDEKIYRFARL
jgi:hypothetical protein